MPEQQHDDTAKRVSVSREVLGHVAHYGTGPEDWREKHQDKLPVQEGEHYTVLAHTMWGDYHVPTVVEWAHGETDSFRDKQESLRNRERAKQEVEP